VTTPHAADKRDLVAPAADLLAAIDERVAAGEALTPTFLDLYSHVSRNLCVAEMAAARTPAQRLAIANDHLDRVKFATHPPIDISDFDERGRHVPLREAELLVAQAQADARGEQRPTEAEKAARRALVDAAREAWETLQQRVDAGEAVTPSLVELVCQASRRWCLAEIDDAADDATRDNARSKHVERIKAFHDMLTKRFQAGLDVSRVQVAQATYFLREAELWVAQAAKK
jgi:hypothetical protein